MNTLTHLSLFSGIGGLDLAAERAGFTTVGQCEWADYPTKVLEKHWPDVPRWRDIRTLTGDDFYARTGLRTVTVLSGGFPCQPFSVAGKRRGTDDDRYLWPEMLRVISEIRPAWVIGENVPGIVNMVLDQVLADLEGQGYACQTFNIPACAVDAPHKRARIAIVGWNARSGERKSQCQIGGVPQRQDAESSGICSVVAHPDSKPGTARAEQSVERPPLQPARSGERGKNVAHPDEPGLQGRQRAGLPERAGERPAGACGAFLPNPDAQLRDGRGGTRNGWTESANGGRWPVEPDVGRVANGIPSRVDRLKCLGNAVVPQQFYPFFKWIAELEAVS